MSIRVESDALERHVLGRPFAYVISTSGTNVHVIAIQVGLLNGHLDCSLVGNSTRRNIVDNPSVTVVFPPAHGIGDDEYGHYSLVIDGSALHSEDRLLIRVESAVLHRPAN